MKRGMTIEYLTSRADLNFEVDFGVNSAIGTIVTKCHNKILLYWDNESFSFIIYIFFFNTLHSPLNEVTKCISLHISIPEHALYSSHGDIIGDLCLARDDYHHPEHLLSCNEIKELIEYLCIISS